MAFHGLFVRCGAVGIIASMLSGCVPSVRESNVRSIHEHGKPTKRQEKKKVFASTAKLEKESINVLVLEGYECMQVTETPREEKSGVVRTLSGGTSAQVTNLALSGLLLAIGISRFNNAASGNCSKQVSASPTSTNPNPVDSERVCTPEEKNEQTSGRQALGLLIAGSAIVPLGAFIWNINRSKDSIETKSISPAVDRTDWSPCDAPVPAAGISVEVIVGGVKKQLKTNDSGEASFPLEMFSGVDNKPDEALVFTIPQDQDKIEHSVSIEKTEFYVEWHKKRQQQDRERQIAAEEMARRKAQEISVIEKKAQTEKFEMLEKRLSKLVVVVNMSQFLELKELEAIRNTIIVDLIPISMKSRVARTDKRLASLSNSPGSKSMQAVVDRERQREEEEKRREVEERRRKAEAEKAAENARKEKIIETVLIAGRKAVLRGLRTPSTANFLSDTIGHICENGVFVTIHEVDAQNLYGAVVRNNFCALIHAPTGAAIPAQCELAMLLSKNSSSACESHLASIKRGFF